MQKVEDTPCPGIDCERSTVMRAARPSRAVISKSVKSFASIQASFPCRVTGRSAQRIKFA